MYIYMILYVIYYIHISIYIYIYNWKSSISLQALLSFIWVQLQRREDKPGGAAAFIFFYIVSFGGPLQRSPPKLPVILSALSCKSSTSSQALLSLIWVQLQPREDKPGEIRNRPGAAPKKRQPLVQTLAVHRR